MIRKLRLKFMLISMVALFAVFTLSFLVINGLNLYSITGRADERFQNLIQTDETTSPYLVGIDQISSILDRNSPYIHRFFYVRKDADGRVLETDTTFISSIDDNEALYYADQAETQERTVGFVKTFRFHIVPALDGGSYDLFLDCIYDLQNVVQFAERTLIVFLLMTLFVFLLIWYFSDLALKPTVLAIEKQKQFITDAGHELKTPLAVISADVDVLELESGRNEWTRSIRNQILHLNDLVKNLLVLSRMDETRTRDAFQQVDLSEIVLDAIRSFQPMAESRNLNLTWDVEEHLTVTGEKRSLEQLLSILMDNAVKYTPSGGSIELGFALESSHLSLKSDRFRNCVLTVTNTCDSLPAGDLSRLFDRFYRTDNSRSKESGGNGIGLSAARAICNAHDASIRAELAGDNALRFQVIMPVSAAK